jgi:hypothetical protein
MLGILAVALLAAAVIKLFFALCGHQITWRMAVVLLVLFVLFVIA